MMRVRLFWIVFLAMVVIDQIIKNWARTAADGVEGRTFWAIWPNVFEFTLKYNKGVAFGMLSGFGQNLWPIAVVITGVCVAANVKAVKEPLAVHLGLSLVAAGAIGNLIDRVWLAQVTDMFHFRAIDFPVFNWADCCISVGAGLLILMWGLEGVRGRHDAAPPAQPSPSVLAEEGDHGPRATNHDS
jgi:signal peptidase II